MLEMLNRYGADDTVVFHQQGELQRWQLAALVRHLAARLEQSGCEPGDRILLALPNSLELLVSYYACLASGLVAVPVNDRLAQREIVRIFKHARARCVISTQTMAEALQIHELASHERLILLDDLHHQVPDRSELPHRIPAWPDAHPAIIFYTSGSTGLPKGALYTHETLRNNSEMFREQFDLGPGDGSVLVHCMAHNFVFTQNAVPFLDAGGAVYIVDFGSAEQTAGALERGASFLSLIPWFGFKLLAWCETHATHAASLRMCMFGGDAVPAAIYKDCPRILGLQAAQFIGMTETNSYAMCPVHANKHKAGSVGLPLPGVSIRIRTADGQTCATGQTGEIQVWTPARMKAYWKDEKQTREIMSAGWIASGDAGHLDSDGFLWFDGRLRNIIVHDGDNIYPAEVEQEISAHPDIKTVTVVGVADTMHGESVAAAAVIREGGRIGLQQLQSFLSERLSANKIPQQLLVLDALPLTKTGKFDRVAIQALFK